MTSSTVTDPFGDLVGQDEVVARLRAAVEAPVHAYLFVGAAGSGKREAVRRFAGAVLGRGKDEADSTRDLELARLGRHPDLVIVTPEGAMFRGGRPTDGTVTEATRYLREMQSSPREGRYKVVVAEQFHTANDEAVGRLLKVIEEPPESSIAVLLADEIPPELVTIASRCVRVDFAPLSPAAISERLVAEGVAEAEAELAAKAAGGNLERARLLASDPGLAVRRAFWWELPVRLDGTGSAVAVLVGEAEAHIDEAQGPLDARHETETAALEERVEQFGERGAGRKVLKERHNRERRRLRTDEIRFGLATLAARYRDALAADGEGGGPRPGDVAGSLAAIQDAAESFEFNPNETLLLQRLLLRLAPLPAR